MDEMMANRERQRAAVGTLRQQATAAKCARVQYELRKAVDSRRILGFGMTVEACAAVGFGVARLLPIAAVMLFAACACWLSRRGLRKTIARLESEEQALLVELGGELG